MSAIETDEAARDLQAVLDRIAAMEEPFTTMATRLHETIVNAAPKLRPRIWYGMPGYAAGRSKPVLVFFRVDDGVMSLGLSEKATVEREPDSTLRASAWFLDEIDDATAAKVADLVRTAIRDKS